MEPATENQPRRWVRAQDAVWLLLFSALALVSPYRTQPEMVILVALGALQLIEPRAAYFATRAGAVIAIVLKLALCYLLVGWTGGITSTYYLIFLVPVVSAATNFRFAGMAAVTAIACLSYLSFLLYLDWRRWQLGEAATGELGLRVVFLTVVGFLTHQLASANRSEARRYQKTAEQLAIANRNLREAEAAVRRSERLAALGQLSAGLAHELRNPLGTIRASAEVLERKMPDGAVESELAGFISTEADRINSLITRFLDFARPAALKREPVQMNELVDRAIAELERHDRRAVFHRNYSPDIPAIAIDPELMQRVFYNLLLNAVEAGGPGAAITAKTRASGEGVEVSIIDLGCGILAADREKIFNPFVTTKPAGIGLGLAIVSKIVDEHGGSIAVESEPGQGSVFRIFLPGNRM